MKEIKENDFAECTFWAVECPTCEEMIESPEYPKKGEEITCLHCDDKFKIK